MEATGISEEAQQEYMMDIAAAYNNRMRPKNKTSKEEECSLLRARLADAMSAINNTLTKVNSEI